MDLKLLSNDFEALIKDGEIYNIKSELRTTDFIKFSVFIILGLGSLLFFTAFNSTIIALLFKTEGKKSTLKDFKKIYYD